MGFVNAFGVIGRLLLAAAMVAGAIGVLATGDARAAWLVGGLSIGITGLVFVGVGSRLGHVSRLSRSLRLGGEEGTATVTGVRSTGVRVNGDAVLELKLDVEVARHGPYRATIRQAVPGFAFEDVAPGARLTVVADTQDPNRLAVDWGSELLPARPEAPPDEPTPLVRDRRDAAELLRTGRKAQAVVISMEDAGDMSELGLVEVGQLGDDDRLFVVDLEVQQAGLDPYEVRVAHPVPERLVGRVGPRTRVDVAVDREDEHAVAIDWDSVHR